MTGITNQEPEEMTINPERFDNCLEEKDMNEVLGDRRKHYYVHATVIVMMTVPIGRRCLTYTLTGP